MRELLINQLLPKIKLASYISMTKVKKDYHSQSSYFSDQIIIPKLLPNQTNFKQECLFGIILPSLTEMRLTSLALAGNQDLLIAISAKK